MSEIRWIKLCTDMFDDEKIKLIQSMPDGDAILIVWIRLIALAGKCNSGGLVLVEDEFPYNDEMLAVIFGKPIATVRLALSTFERFKMIENTEKGIYITNFNKHQNITGMDKIREQNRLRKQRERNKKKELLLENSFSTIENKEENNFGSDTDKSRAVTSLSHDMSRDITEKVTDMSQEVTQQNKNKKKNNISISPNGNIDIVGTTSADTCPAAPKKDSKHIAYDRIMEDYNRICINLPKVQIMSENRRKKIRGLRSELDKLKIMQGKTVYEQFNIIFQMVHESDFLSGRDGKWCSCSFDWIMEKAHIFKIIEGNYVNKESGNYDRDNKKARNNSQYNNAVYGTGENTAAALERFRRNKTQYI